MSAKENLEWQRIKITIKQILAKKKMTYKDLADAMNMSESSMKRLLSSSDIKFNKILEICSCLDVDFYDLVETAKYRKEHTFRMTQEQEEFLAKNPIFYAIFSKLLQGHKLDGLAQQYQLSPKFIYEFVKKMEEFQFLVRMPDNKIKLTQTGVINLIPGGPLNRILLPNNNLRILESYKNSIEKSGFEEICCLTNSLRRVRIETLKDIKKQVIEFASGIRKQIQIDEKTTPNEELVEMAMLFCVTPQKSLPTEILDAYKAKKAKK